VPQPTAPTGTINNEDDDDDNNTTAIIYYKYAGTTVMPITETTQEEK
jgi:hypothetical protein